MRAADGGEQQWIDHRAPARDAGRILCGSAEFRHFPPSFDEEAIRRFVVGALSLRGLMVAG